MSQIQFRKIRGRIVPIQVDDDRSHPKRGAAKILAGTTIAATGSISGRKDLTKSYRQFRKAAIHRGFSRKENMFKFARELNRSKAAALKIAGKRSAIRARTKFGIAIGLGAALISSGTVDLFDPKSDIKDEVAGITGTVVTGGIVALAAKKFGIKATSVDKLFSKFATSGKKLSRLKTRSISGKSTKFKVMKFDL